LAAEEVRFISWEVIAWSGLSWGEFGAPAMLLWPEDSDYNTVKTYIRREEQFQERGKLNAALRGLYISNFWDMWLFAEVIAFNEFCGHLAPWNLDVDVFAFSTI
jgi:hypothetical protein